MTSVLAGDELVQVRVASVDHQLLAELGDRLGHQAAAPDLGLGAAQFDVQLKDRRHVKGIPTKVSKTFLARPTEAE